MKQFALKVWPRLKAHRVRYAGHLAFTLVIAFSLAPVRTMAAENSQAAETPWIKALHAEARLVASGKGEHAGRNTLLAGIHVKLDPGWKTYWRSPGDSGLPPSFDWSGSVNLKSAQVLWPAPQRFADPFGSSIGYHDEVVFPVVIKAADPDRPIDFSVKFDYAVCKDICVPAQAALKLMLAPGGQTGSRHEGLLSRYLKQVPVETGSGANRPSLAKVKIELAQPKPEILVDAVFPGGTKNADLFIEGPKFFFLPLPKQVAEGPGNRIRYRVDLTKGDDPKELKGKTLTFTLVSAAGHAETTKAVD
ncbi:MAG: protein-disulfide reductase DsbD family protein [Hyphomicrobiales bacterium]|nr:protein-disulfide reductase DsbD family protein [Hyphomicrobiales bacterium]